MTAEVLHLLTPLFSVEENIIYFLNFLQAASSLISLIYFPIPRQLENVYKCPYRL